MNPNEKSPISLRPITIETQVNRYAEGSALIKMGNTHVLCTASVEDSVPGWMQGKGSGWITAEYSMLPRSTHTRTKRDREKISGRTQEIQRLVGRALRAMVDLSKLGERSVLIDCDVLQADGGTRTASITGACVALAIALDYAAKTPLKPSRSSQSKNPQPSAPLAQTWIDTVAAVSVGLKDGELYVDLNYELDSTCDVDMNFVITGRGHFVEVQGTAERAASSPTGGPVLSPGFSKMELDRMSAAATSACASLKSAQLQALERAGIKSPFA